MKAVEFTENEAQVLLSLIDVAVRSQGLQAANAALTLAGKVKAAFDEPQGGFEPKQDDEE